MYFSTALMTIPSHLSRPSFASKVNTWLQNTSVSQKEVSHQSSPSSTKATSKLSKVYGANRLLYVNPYKLLQIYFVLGFM